nr:MAG TPA: hypothetical protein [Caudoviricetes sp.]
MVSIHQYLSVAFFFLSLNEIWFSSYKFLNDVYIMWGHILIHHLEIFSTKNRIVCLLK